MSNDGGPAFTLPGMSLRDWFAAQALTGMLAAQADPSVETLPSPKEAADYAYKVADAMLARRESK